jgi:NitT/TauT family transport system substrate-binding protein
VTTKQSPLRTAKDLEGKTVAVNGLKNLPHIATMAWIDKNGGDSSAVKFIEIPIPATQAALSSGRVDAAILNEPFLSAALQADARVFGNCYEAIAKDFTYGAFVATQQWASDHPDLVRAFRSIVYESSRWANTHVAAASEILMRDAKLDVSALKNHDAYAEKFDPSLMQPVIDASAKYGVIKASFPVSEMVAHPL